MTDRAKPDDPAAPTSAEIEREYRPFDGTRAPAVHGVTFDGERVWFATDGELHAIDPATGARLRSLDIAADAGTAFDGTHLYQLTGGRIHKIDPASGRVLRTIEPAEPADDFTGLTWAEGRLWVGRYESRQILQLDPESGAVLRRLESDRFVTGVTFAGDELWHATEEDGESELRQVDPHSGRVRTRARMPKGAIISGLESDGRDRFYAGGGKSGTVRVLRKPRPR